VHAPAIRHEPAALNYVAEIYLAARERERAESMLPYLLERRGHFVSWGIFGLCTLGPFTGLIARVEALLERWSEATHDFESAIAETGRTGALPAQAELHYEYGRALLERPGGAERALGLAQLTQGMQLAHELDMPGLARRARHALESVEPHAVTQPLTPARAPSASAVLGFELTREGDVWLVARGARSFRLKDSRGLQMLSVLLHNPGRELHVLMLGSAGEPMTAGDAGGVIDPRAARAYRQRLEDLRDAEQEAEALGDSERLAAARGEIEQLAQQLAQGLGLGGRERRAASVSERARTNVQRRIKDAIARIEKCDPELGRYLGWTVRTGTFCVFEPGARPV
jgi:hypothetical protein